MKMEEYVRSKLYNREELIVLLNLFKEAMKTTTTLKKKRRELGKKQSQVEQSLCFLKKYQGISAISYNEAMKNITNLEENKWKPLHIREERVDEDGKTCSVKSVRYKDDTGGVDCPKEVRRGEGNLGELRRVQEEVP